MHLPLVDWAKLAGTWRSILSSVAPFLTVEREVWVGLSLLDTIETDKLRDEIDSRAVQEFPGKLGDDDVDYDP